MVFTAGLVLGYPRIAVEQFERYFGKALTVAEKLWAKAEAQGVPTTVNQPIYLFDIHEPGNFQEPVVRDEFVRLAKLFQYPEVDLVEYVSQLRIADIPGWGYMTSGSTTQKDEYIARENYRLSNFDQKLEALLKEYAL